MLRFVISRLALLIFNCNLCMPNSHMFAPCPYLLSLHLPVLFLLQAREGSRDGPGWQASFASQWGLPPEKIFR